jgi:ArsR family transcriptional regulator, arsenate/arsenite/antimonite-responsive transcriptional repressor / arsenate reductase (thioredoxin)
MKAAQNNSQPLAFLKLLAHDIRWRLLQILARSDYRVEELVREIQQPHNLISYHLKRLRHQQVVNERRSSVDARDIYYSLNVDTVRQLYLQAGQSLHPALSQTNSQPEPRAKTITHRPVRVLFLCTHNSARSQMAEGLLRRVGGDQVEVFSAGSEPTSIHPLAIKVMSGTGIDLRQHRSKHLSEYVGKQFDYIVTVCDRVREACPVFLGDPEQIHWSFPDPAAVAGNARTQEKAFVSTFQQLNVRIQYLLLMIQRHGGDKG